MNLNWLGKLERKYGRFRIPGLMKYIVGIEIAGAVIGMINPYIYYMYFALDFGKVFQGQIWRLFTFILYPEIDYSNVMGILFFAIEVYLYYMIGSALESVWGSFRFTLYYISGIVLSVLAGLFVYLLTGMPWLTGFEYINESLFLAFAAIFPNMEFLLFFMLPVKAKWLGILYAAMLGFNIFRLAMSGTASGIIYAIAIIVSMLNFIIFFLGNNRRRISYGRHKRKAQFKREAGPKVTPLYRHRCAICGRTERDNENLEFRYCSKCDGNYEYCSDHIYTHEHVHR